MKKERAELKHTSIQKIYFLNTEEEKAMKPFFSEKNIAIEMTATDSIIPYCAIALESLVDNSNPAYNYDILILHTEVSDKSQEKLIKSFSGYTNVSIRFYNLYSEIESLELHAIMHIPIQSALRLFMPDIFPNYERILHLDADIIVCDDIAKLYNIEMGDCLVAATHDADFCGQYKMDLNEIKDYTHKVLKIDNPYNQYFQAGVVLFNIAEMRRTFWGKELIIDCVEKKYRYFDQDTLNYNCLGRVKFIDTAWNVMTDCGGSRINDVIRKGPARIYDDYMKARKEPKIIHYAGFEKPWDAVSCDFADFFWEYARKTPFYEECLLRLNKKKQQEIEDTSKVNLDQAYQPDPINPNYWHRFIFPWNLVKTGSNIIIRGGGVVGQVFYRQLQDTKYANIIAICDSSSDCPKELDVSWIRPCSLPSIDCDYIVIAIEKKSIASEMIKELTELGIPNKKIVYKNPARV